MNSIWVMLKRAQNMKKNMNNHIYSIIFNRKTHRFFKYYYYYTKRKNENNVQIINDRSLQKNEKKNLKKWLFNVFDSNFINKTKNIFYDLSVKKSIDDIEKQKIDNQNDNENEKNNVRKLLIVVFWIVVRD